MDTNENTQTTSGKGRGIVGVSSHLEPCTGVVRVLVSGSANSTLNTRHPTPTMLSQYSGVGYGYGYGYGYGNETAVQGKINRE